MSIVAMVVAAALSAMTDSPAPSVSAPRADAGLERAQFEAWLGVSSTQRPLVERYLQVVNAPAPEGPDEDAVARMSTPERLAVMEAAAAEELAAIKERRVAVDALYAVLTPEQKAKLDDCLEPDRRPEEGAPQVLALQSLIAKKNYSLPAYTRPDWLVKPSGDVVARVYPSLARHMGVKGRVMLRCVSDAQGYLYDCVVDEETPADSGFGNAALEMSAYFRMKPGTRYGVPVEATVTIPLTFMLDPSDPPGVGIGMPQTSSRAGATSAPR